MKISYYHFALIIVCFTSFSQAAFAQAERTVNLLFIFPNNNENETYQNLSDRFRKKSNPSQSALVGHTAYCLNPLPRKVYSWQMLLPAIDTQNGSIINDEWDAVERIRGGRPVSPEFGGNDDDIGTVSTESINSGQTIPSNTNFDLFQAFRTNTAYHSRLIATTCRAIENKAPIVAFLDSGVDPTHPLLQQYLWRAPRTENSCCSDLRLVKGSYGYNFINNTSNPIDGNSHGTHVMGITAKMLANQGYTTPRLMAVKVLDDNNKGKTLNILRGISFAVCNGATIINMSIVAKTRRVEGLPHIVEYVMKELAKPPYNVLFVCSSGNDSAMASNLGNNRCVIPASFNLPNQVNVAAATSTLKLARFSNRGNDVIHLAAPGETITSMGLNGSIVQKSGSSQAAPFVTAAAAMIVASSNANLTPTDIRAQLKNNIMRTAPVTLSTIQTGWEAIYNQTAWGGLVSLPACPVIPCSQPLQASIAPNPFSHSLTVNFKAEQDEIFTINLTDFNGRILLNQIIESVKGNNTTTLQTADLPKGLYILTLSTEKEIVAYKVMK
jgi:hypothetical protein